MPKSIFSKSAISLVANSFINIVTIVLTIAIAFNLSWFLMFIRLYNQITIVKDFNKAVFNLESWLIIGNLSIFILFITYALGMKNLKSVIKRKY